MRCLDILENGADWPCNNCFPCGIKKANARAGALLLHAESVYGQAIFITLTLSDDQLKTGIHRTGLPKEMVITSNRAELARLDLIKKQYGYEPLGVFRFSEIPGSERAKYYEMISDRFIKKEVQKITSFRARIGREVQETDIQFAKNIATKRAEYFINQTYVDNPWVIANQPGAVTGCTYELQQFQIRLADIGADNGFDVEYKNLNESGTRTERPHYHAVIFLKSINGDFFQPDQLEKIGLSMVEKAWLTDRRSKRKSVKGFVQVSALSPNRAHYACGYTVKKPPAINGPHGMTTGKPIRVDGSLPDGGGQSHRLGWAGMEKRVSKTVNVLTKLEPEAIAAVAELSEAKRDGITPKFEKTQIMERHQGVTDREIKQVEVIRDIGYGRVDIESIDRETRAVKSNVYRLPYRIRDNVMKQLGIADKARKELYRLSELEAKARYNEMTPDELRRETVDEIKRIRKSDADYAAAGKSRGGTGT